MNPQEQALRTQLETGAFQTNFLVEAGAGAGKSHTICQRILHQLMAGREPETIAAITFTEKAALELQTKLDRQALDHDRARGTALAALTTRVHVSTIHSFCQTALGLFPLEAGAGLQVLSDERRRAEDFFRRWTALDADGNTAALAAFGGSAASLSETFLTLAADGRVPTLFPASERAARQADLDGLTAGAHALVRMKLSPCQGAFSALPEAMSQAAETSRPTAEQLTALKRLLLEAWKQTSRPKRLSALLFTGHPQVKALLEEYLEASKKKNREADPDRLKALPPIFAAVDQCREELEKIVPAMADLEQAVGYDLAMNILAPALRAYLAERDRAGLVTFSGLLTKTRDLVRDMPAARALLHRRYQVFYVDEFQDTDPVQAELLFLITHGGPAGERDWTRCRPAPGSLFLVGDPKQAIYRFRGADLDVYKRVKALFTDPARPVGQVVSLRANFRSTPRICAFVDRVFAPRDQAGNILPVTEQARNQANPAVTGLLDDGLYQANYVPMEAQQGDQGRDAVFSFPAQLPGDGPEGAAGRVARFIRRAAAGGCSLPDRQGRPVPIRYGDFLLLTRRKSEAGRYLEALSDLGIPVTFSADRSLEEDPQLRRLEVWLRWLLEPDSELALIRLLEDCFGVTDLACLRQLKTAAQCALPALVSWGERRAEVRSPETAFLLDTLETVGDVLADSRALPPMAFLEKLAEERLFQPGDAASPRERQRQYGDLRQLLRQLRQSLERDLPGLAREALTLCRGSLERELPLSPAADTVRLMNLHKAKGLEGRIVILLPDAQTSGRPRKAEGVCAVTRPGGSGASLLYAPLDWEKRVSREMGYLEAEQVRLDYVAATRAEQLLLIAEGGTGKRSIPCWQAMASAAPPVRETTPGWGDFFLPLSGAACAPLPVSPAPAVPPPPDLTARRESRIAAQSVPNQLHASPSTLDKSHLVLPAPEAPDEPGVPLEWEEGAARGADWGTAVHRVMELCVSNRTLEPEAARPLIAQALGETLPPLSRLTAAQKELLFGPEVPESDEAGRRVLGEKLERAAAFWFDAASPLRRLAEDGLCRCELPFHLLLSPEDETWSFIRERLDCPESFDGTITVSGILDLAVLTEGGWQIVDYKTDRPRSGESREDYRRRLAGEYRAQLEAYVRILSRLSGRAVLGAQLCAVPLGGELIRVV